MLLAIAFREPDTPKYCKDVGYGDLGNYVPEAGVCNPHADEGAHTLTVLLAVSAQCARNHGNHYCRKRG